MIAIIKLRVFFLVRVQTGEQSRSGAKRLILKMTRKETVPPPAALAAAAPTRDAGTQTAEPVETEDDLTSSEESDTSSEEEEDNQDDDSEGELFAAKVLGLTLGEVKFPHSRKR